MPRHRVDDSIPRWEIEAKKDRCPDMGRTEIVPCARSWSVVFRTNLPKSAPGSGCTCNGPGKARRSMAAVAATMPAQAPEKRRDKDMVPRRTVAIARILIPPQQRSSMYASDCPKTPPPLQILLFLRQRMPFQILFILTQQGHTSGHGSLPREWQRYGQTGAKQPLVAS